MNTRLPIEHPPAMKRLLRFTVLALTIWSSLSLSAAQKTVVQEPLDVTTGNPTMATRRIPQRNRMVHRPRTQDETTTPIPFGPPIEQVMTKADSVQLDLRLLPQVTTQQHAERPERQPPFVAPVQVQQDLIPTLPTIPQLPAVNAPAPSPSSNFAGLDYASWGAGHPPDTNGDVGPVYYIQAINTAVGVYQKSDGARVAAFTFNALMSQGHFGNLCDTDNYGDPVVLYDTFEDRWILTDFAFQLDGDDVINPPGSFQCFAVSRSGDPVSGGWNFYSINTAGGLGDYPKFGIWPDGLYMTANMWDYLYSGSYLNPRVYAFNKAQMYAGKSSIQNVSFDVPSDEITVLPANARLQTGTPPAGSPNYYAVIWDFADAVSIYKFHVDWDRISLSSFTGPYKSLAPAAWSDPPDFVPELSGSSLDTLPRWLMAQNQYTNQGGVESLWMNHTVLGAAASIAAPRYYQVGVNGGTVAANTSQAFTYTPDSTMNRFMGSLAVDRAGDMALGYSTTNSSTHPAIKYSGRLATDPVNSLPQTEVSLINGTGSQSGINRWGDYSAMSLDPDGCRFWYTSEYYATSGISFLTRIGAFAFPSCTPVGSGGTLQGTVTAAAGGAPLSGVAVAFGARAANTGGSGTYSYSGIPAGTYPAVTVSKPGYVSQTAAPIVITEGGSTTKDFALVAAPASDCLIDTTQADFQTGVPTTIDLTTSSGNVTLATSLTGNLVSALKDSNPAAGLVPSWLTLSWTGSAPANTTIKFQVAGSNSDFGPFNFVGPDGTSATFFTSSGASLAQFSGLRYVKYKAYLSTTVISSKPVLNDVTLCFSNGTCNLAAPTISGGPADGCANGSVTLTSSSATGNQWFLNSLIISGATSQSYLATTSGSYTVQLTSGGCSALSAPKQLTMITVNPATISDGAAGSAYSAAFSSTGGVGSVTLSESGSLPAGVQFSNGALSGTPSSAGAGTFTITVTATDANGCTASRNYTFTIASAAGSAPVNLRATAASASQVTITWTPVATATGYQVLRGTSNASLVTIAAPASNSYVDTQGLAAGTTYIYKVRAAGPGFPGTLSASDIATTIVFTDDPIVIGSTLLKGVHLTEARTAVNAVRAAAGLAAAAFTDAAPSGLSPKALYIQELRAALDPARSAIGVPAMTYGNAANAGTVVRATDLAEIRNGVK
jgi:hypothetical protein